MIEKTTDALNEPRKALKGSKVLVLGVAYKRDIDDLRESPSLTIIELLRREGGAWSPTTTPTFPLSAGDASTI